MAGCSPGAPCPLCSMQASPHIAKGRMSIPLNLHSTKEEIFPLLQPSGVIFKFGLSFQRGGASRLQRCYCAGHRESGLSLQSCYSILTPSSHCTRAGLRALPPAELPPNLCHTSQAAEESEGKGWVKRRWWKSQGDSWDVVK